MSGKLSKLTMLLHLDRQVAWSAVLLAVVCTLYAGEDAANKDTAKKPSGDSKVEIPKALLNNPKRKKLIHSLMRQLGRLKPLRTPKKDLDDFFLLGTAELDLATRNANVCFQVKQGQREVAELLVDYVLDAPENTIRKWHVFYRLKDSQQAEQALQLTQTQYDQMQAYQTQIRKIYGAKTTRRT